MLADSDTDGIDRPVMTSVPPVAATVVAPPGLAVSAAMTAAAGPSLAAGGIPGAEPGLSRRRRASLLQQGRSGPILPTRHRSPITVLAKYAGQGSEDGFVELVVRLVAGQ